MDTPNLNRAWKLIEHTGWTQKSMAKNSQGCITPYNSDTACSFCISGAIARVYPSSTVRDKKMNKIREHLRSKSEDQCIPVLWNDSPERTKEEVISLLKKLDI